MTPEILEFVRDNKDIMWGPVLEIGSYDVNGSVREVLDIDIGIDMREGPGVDIVMDAVDLPTKFGLGSIASIICIDVLEHCKNWKGVVLSAWATLEDEGALLLTAANPNKCLHNYPGDYWRFTLKHFEDMFKNHIIHETVRGRVCDGVLVEKQGILEMEDLKDALSIEDVFGSRYRNKFEKRARKQNKPTR